VAKQAPKGTLKPTPTGDRQVRRPRRDGLPQGQVAVAVKQVPVPPPPTGTGAGQGKPLRGGRGGK
jgi:hypothetical protein